MPNNDYNQRREPFEMEDSWETEAGTTIEVGEEVLAKPTFVNMRIPAVVESIYWDPKGLPGGRFDHRGEKIGETEDGDPIFERPADYDCQLTVRIRFEPGKSHEYSHIAGKTKRVEAYNLDFVIGDSPEVRRDRANSNA